jgi:hypothetical protein
MNHLAFWLQNQLKTGSGEIGYSPKVVEVDASRRGGRYKLAGSSRTDKARTLNDEQYETFRRREAKRLGIEL